ncbi:MAG: hypothetical protein ABIH00_04480 [Armatimonadota bacterium]
MISSIPVRNYQLNNLTSVKRQDKLVAEADFTVKEFDEIMESVKGRAGFEDPEAGYVVIYNKEDAQYILYVNHMAKLIKKDGKIIPLKVSPKQMLEEIWWFKTITDKANGDGISIVDSPNGNYVMVKDGTKKIYFNISSEKYITVNGKIKKSSTEKEKILFMDKVAAAIKKKDDIVLKLLFEMITAKE